MNKTRKRKLTLRPREAGFLHKWLNRKGVRYIDKFKNVPELIVTEYEGHLSNHAYTFPAYYTSEERLQVIKTYVDYTLNIRPLLRRYLKLWNMKEYEIGLMLGYSSAMSWRNSYRRYTYIRVFVALIQKHQEVLEGLV